MDRALWTVQIRPKSSVTEIGTVRSISYRVVNAAVSSVPVPNESPILRIPVTMPRSTWAAHTLLSVRKLVHHLGRIFIVSPVNFILNYGHVMD